MNLKEMQKHHLLAALGACLAAMLLVSPAAAGQDENGASGQSERSPIVNQRQLELASDASSIALAHTPDGYQPQLGGSEGATASPVSLGDRPDGYQPQLGGSELAVVADDGFDWSTTGFAASLIAAMLVVAAATFTYGNRRGYRSA